MDMTHELEQRQSMESFGSKQPIDDLVAYFTDYAKQRPGVAALWCFGIGFVLGWKLKPW